MNLNDIERYQMKKFRWFLKRIYDFHPYYGKLLRKLKLKPNNFKTLKDLDKIPFTKKPDWVGKEKDFILTPNQKKIIYYISPWDMLLFVFKKEKFMRKIKYEYAPATFFATSGRTGTPSTCFYTRYDFELIAKQGNISTRHMVKELNNNVRLQIMFPYAPHLAFWHATFGWLNNSHIFATLLGSGRTRLQASLLDKFKINAIMGMPSYVKYFSEVVIEENAKSYVRYIILGGEAAQKALVKRIKDNFGSLGTVPTVIRTYALTESKVAIFENEEDGGYIINPDLHIWQVVDPKTGETLDYGESGVIVFSHIDFRGTVFLRYWTDDYIKGGIFYEDGNLKMIGDIYRVSDEKELQITKVKGTLINTIALENVLNSIEEIKEFQILITKRDPTDKFSLDELIIKVAPRTNIEDNTKKLITKIRHLIKDYFEITPKVEIEEFEILVENIFGKLKGTKVLDLRKHQGTMSKH